MSDSISGQPDRATTSDRTKANTMEQSRLNAPQTSSSDSRKIYAKYMQKSLSGAFVQREDLKSTWKYAIITIPPRVICLQPTSNDGIPGVLQACRESREEAKKTFTVVKSSQPTLPFTLVINYANDTIYLNRNFRDKATERFPSALQTAIHFYKDTMKKIREVAFNLGDMYHLTTAYRAHDGKRDLWQMLYENCPKLEMVKIVIDGPQKGRNEIQFRRLYRISNCDDAEFVRRHPHLVSVMGSAVMAKKKGFCTEVIKGVVSIDQIKKLRMKDGEKENKDGKGVYDSYGISHYQMRWVSKAKARPAPPALRAPPAPATADSGQ